MLSAAPASAHETALPPPLPFPEPLQVGDRWIFAFEREGSEPVERQAVVALVRPQIEVVLYVGPQRYAIPWTEAPAAFAHATRGVLRAGRARPADAPPPTASASFPRLPPPEPEAPPKPAPVVAPPVPVEPIAPLVADEEGGRRGRRARR